MIVESRHGALHLASVAMTPCTMYMLVAKLQAVYKKVGNYIGYLAILGN